MTAHGFVCKTSTFNFIAKDQSDYPIFSPRLELLALLSDKLLHFLRRSPSLQEKMSLWFLKFSLSSMGEASQLLTAHSSLLR